MNLTVQCGFLLRGCSCECRRSLPLLLKTCCATITFLFTPTRRHPRARRCGSPFHRTLFSLSKPSSPEAHGQEQLDGAIIVAPIGSTDEGCAAAAAALLHRHLHTPGHLLLTSTTTRSSSPTPLPRSKREHEWDASHRHRHRAVAERPTPPAHQHNATYENLDKLYHQTQAGPCIATHAANHQKHSRSEHGRSTMVPTSHAGRAAEPRSSLTWTRSFTDAPREMATWRLL